MWVRDGCLVSEYKTKFIMKESANRCEYNSDVFSQGGGAGESH